MTIPQANSTDLRSVSDRQEVVTLAEVGATPEVTNSDAFQADDKVDQLRLQEGENSLLTSHEQRLVTNDLPNAIESACSNTLVIIESDTLEQIKGAVHEKGEEKEIEECLLGDEKLEETIDSPSDGNHNALKIDSLVLSSQDTCERSGELENGVIEREQHNVDSLHNTNIPLGCQQDKGIVSALPLLRIPSHQSTSTPSVSYDHRTRKSSINFPITSHESSRAIAVSSSSGSSYSLSPSLSNPRKNRRKSLPQRLGLRYQKIPQYDVVSNSETRAIVTEAVESGILNPQYIPSPDSAPLSSPSQDNSHPQLSFHNAEVHASFHYPQTSPEIPNIPNQSVATTISQSQVISKTSQRDVSFAPSKVVTNKTGSVSNPSKEVKKKPLSAITSASTSSSSTSKTRDKPGRGARGNKSSLPLRKTLSLSFKSLNDLSVIHPTGRGNSNRKKHKSHSRSVSTEDLANCRVHQSGGGRFAGDPHPSPGSPSHCCLVSVSRVPMAAATSHLTLDSEYQTVRLAVLGAPGVGKSSIVKQFVMQQFLEEYVPTEQRQVFCPAVIINDHLYEVRIIDCPYIPYFPVNSLYEWTDFRGYGLRNATAYVLVYDITSEESFEYIKSLRLQILESRNLHDVPIFVVGNKHDLAEERGVPRREVANLVKKQWKCGYIECSAKYNWHIMLLFKELMKTVDYIDYGHKPTSLRVQDALRRNRCLIL